MTAGFFDRPEHRPPSNKVEVGEAIEGTVDSLEIRRNSYGRDGLVYAIDGRERWAPGPLWRLLAAERVDTGQRIRIERLPDEPLGNGKTASAWRVQRLDAAAPAW